MKTPSGKLSRILAALAVSTALSAAGATAAWASPGMGFAERPQMNPERMHERMQARLDKMAERLEIKASQQDAWKAYAKARESLVPTNLKPPARDADAAAIARHRADRAAEMAQKLAAISDATARLQEVLSEDQRKTFDQMSRRAGSGRHGGHRGHGGPGWGHR